MRTQYEDFWSLENSDTWKSRKKVFKRNSHTRTHTRIFGHWKIPTPENPEKKVFKRNSHTRTHTMIFATGKFRHLKTLEKFFEKRNPLTHTHTRIFDWKIPTPEIPEKKVIKRNPARVHMRRFLTTGKFSTTISINFEVFKKKIIELL